MDIANLTGGTFVPGNYDTVQDFEPIPPGEYPVLIERAEVKKNGKKTGYGLKLGLSVIDGEHKGRKVFANITLSNPNQKAVEIGHRELATLGQALGMVAITDSSEVTNKTMTVKVKVKEDKVYGKQNEITTYKPYGQVQPQQPAQPQQQAQPPQQPTQQPAPTAAPQQGAGQMPWQK